jgi:uncharacterized membrane protein YhaH (DUF805 family)
MVQRHFDAMTPATSVSAFSFQGRISRASFWAVIGVTILVIGVFAVLLTVLLPNSSAAKVSASAPGWVTIVVGVVYVSAIWVSLANYAKRLHDLDHSGWLALLLFVPLLNLIMWIWCGVKAGTPGPNRFGPGPLKVSISARAR